MAIQRKKKIRLGNLSGLLELVFLGWMLSCPTF